MAMTRSADDEHSTPTSEAAASPSPAVGSTVLWVALMTVGAGYAMWLIVTALNFPAGAAMGAPVDSFSPIGWEVFSFISEFRLNTYGYPLGILPAAVFIAALLTTATGYLWRRRVWGLGGPALIWLLCSVLWISLFQIMADAKLRMLSLPGLVLPYISVCVCAIAPAIVLARGFRSGHRSATVASQGWAFVTKVASVGLIVTSASAAVVVNDVLEGTRFQSWDVLVAMGAGHALTTMLGPVMCVSGLLFWVSRVLLRFRWPRALKLVLLCAVSLIGYLGIVGVVLLLLYGGRFYALTGQEQLLVWALTVGFALWAVWLLARRALPRAVRPEKAAKTEKMPEDRVDTRAWSDWE